MAFRFIPIPEHTESTATPPTYTSKWKAVGDPSQTYVHIYANAATPPTVLTIYGTLHRQDIRVVQVAYNQFDVTVPYAKNPNANGSWTWDFDTTGGTVHITHAEEVARYPAGVAPPLSGTIGLDKDQVNGTDIIIPAMKFNVQYKHPSGELTLARSKFLSNITGTVNGDTFLTYAPGEVLFLGARGSDGSDSEVTANYQFAMSANLDNGTIGGIAGVNKKGHEHAWIQFADAVVNEAGVNFPTRKPKHVYVNRPYEEIPMATALGFGA